MNVGTVAVPSIAPQQNDGAPSAVALVYDSPSPANPAPAQKVLAGESSAFTFGDFINGLEKKTVSAVTTITNQAKYKSAIISGTIGKAYYGTVAGVTGAFADSGTAVLNVAKKVEAGSTLLFVGIVAFLLFPYLIALRRK